MIRNIHFDHPSLVRELFELQRASYLIEAELIQFYEIPPLKESFEELMKCNETFIGYFDLNELAGALSYTIKGDELTICLLVVHPRYFRKGIAQKLLTSLEEQHNYLHVFKVSTGKDNIPAKRLYQKNGYQFISDSRILPGFFISYFEKRR